MKKYIAAGGVAVVAFAFAASAASLNVSGAVLQVGETAEGELECADAASVVAWGYNDHLAGGPISAATVDLSANHSCDGETLYLTLLKEDGSAFPARTASLVAGQNRYEIALSPDAPSGIPAAEIHGVRIGIDQGATPPAPVNN